MDEKEKKLQETLNRLKGCRRPVDKIIIHCAATYPKQDIDAATIDRWHKELGWSGIGYHAVIKKDGTLECGRDIEVIGAHCVGYNTCSVGICLIGGLNEAGRACGVYTEPQMRTLAIVVRALMEHYKIDARRVYGHQDFANKACPCFNVRRWACETLTNG